MVLFVSSIAKTGKLEKEQVHGTCGSAIACLCYDSRSRILTDADIDSSVISYRLNWEQKTRRVEKVFERREGMAITQLFANYGCTRLLVSAHTSDTLCTSSTDEYGTILTSASPDRKSHKWSTHPVDRTQLIFFADNTAHLFSWARLERIKPSTRIRMTESILPELFIISITSCFGGKVIATNFAEAQNPSSSSGPPTPSPQTIHPQLRSHITNP